MFLKHFQTIFIPNKLLKTIFHIKDFVLKINFQQSFFKFGHTTTTSKTGK